MDLKSFILVAPILLFSMVAHEYAHGYAALKQGDTTAYQLGRLTLNPLKHIDPFLTILLPVMLFFTSGGRFVFGGAKPVPVIPRNYKHYRRGDIIVSLAGIATNLVLAGLCALFIVPLGVLGRATPAIAPTFSLLQEMMVGGVYFNLMLAFFNLLPIPPLDGSHVFKHVLPPSWAIRYVALGRFGFLLLFAFMWVGQRWLALWMSPAMFLTGKAVEAVSPFRLPPVTL